ncbi:flagellar hook-basal body protein [Bacillus suaedaesalsae]|uniref:flagellar hook-basal body protein n=1 Tax=Bacillus suaedaesalsae TaxID=2810349 RepID=UPI001EF6DFFC|nr:flagellar hook-basal body protein [Bacillus suaedaesalsae]
MINRSLITATNTMTQLQKQLDNISNNLANIDTVGFKRRETNFQELLFQQFNNQPIDRNEAGRLTPNGVRQGVGAKVSHTSLQLAQGSIKTTERALDVALLKENQFFEVEVDGQTRFTRDGSFSLSVLPSGDVQLVTSEGYPVSSENGPIIFQEGYNNLIIDANGQLNVQYPNGANEVFNLSVVQINRPQLLQSAGNNVYSLPNLAEINVLEADVFAAIGRNDIAMQQGALEQSNVEMQKEMTELINTQRSYQFNAKSISIADQMLGLINGIR